MTAPDLAYVALVIDEPDASAAIFEKDFGLPRQNFTCGSLTVPAIAVGRSALALFQPDDPFLGPDAKKGVHHIAIAAADPKAAAEDSGVATVNGPASGLGGRASIELARDAAGGIVPHLSLLQAQLRLRRWRLRGAEQRAVLVHVWRVSVGYLDITT